MGSRAIWRKAASATAALFVMLCVHPAAAQKSAFDPSAPAASPILKAEAEHLAQKVWSSVLRSCGRYALESPDGRIVIELDDPKFTLAAMRQPDAAKESGYEFRGVALASAARWRWARQTGSVLKWSPWRLGQPTVVRDDNLTLDRGFSANDDVVLKFDIVKKDGAWSANFPISTLNYAVRPLDPQSIASSPTTPSCRGADAS